MMLQGNEKGHTSIKAHLKTKSKEKAILVGKFLTS